VDLGKIVEHTIFLTCCFDAHRKKSWHLVKHIVVPTYVIIIKYCNRSNRKFFSNHWKNE